MAVGIIVLGQVVYIQNFQGQAYRELSTETTLKYGELEATRGNIHARDGKLLATTVPLFDIRMDVYSPNISDDLFRKKVDSLALGLHKLFSSRSKQEYKKMLQDARRNKDRYLLIKRDVDYAILKEIKKLPILRLGPFKGGLIVQQKNTRKMPYGILAKRTIGYESQDKSVYVGLEGAYNEDLKGTQGRTWLQRISGGEWIPVLNHERIEPRNGKDIVTTIDVQVQDVAERALMRALIENEAYQGCAVLMEIATGDIRAIANLRRNNKGQFDEIYNYALAESIEPGSTFKLAALVAAIEYGSLNPSDSVPYQGQIRWSNLDMRDDHPLHKPYITVLESFIHSSNVGVSKFVEKSFRKKPQRFSEVLLDMEIGKPLGIEFQGEGKPFIRSHTEKRWPLTTLPFMAIGYEVTLTPLQTLTFYNAIANNGVMVKPRFVREVSEQGKTLITHDPVVLNASVCSEKTAAIARGMMEAVVEKGTAHGAFAGAPYKVAGKTGTAQIAKGGKYNKENYNASFVGYFPADNPKYSIIVVINNPMKGRIYGGAVAAPVFREIADRVYATELGVHAYESVPVSTRNLQVDSLNSNPVFCTKMWVSDVVGTCRLMGLPCDTSGVETAWGYAFSTEKGVKVKPMAFSTRTLPDLTGMSATDAVYLLEAAGMKVIVQGRGRVRSQSVPAGKALPKGSTVTINLSPSAS